MLKVYAQRTVSNNPLGKFNFRVSLTGLPAGLGFQKVSGLNRELGVVEYREGLNPHTRKLTGIEKVGEVTLERGAYISKELENLYKKSLEDRNTRNVLIIEVLSPSGEVLRSHKLAEAWVSKWEFSDLDASSDDPIIESITVQFERFLN
jgi:phage tail-like protein